MPNSLPKEAWSDPDLYAELSAPVSAEEANARLSRFAAGLFALRKECEVADVVCAYAVRRDNDEVAMGSLMLGSSAVGVPMIASLYGEHVRPVMAKAEALAAMAGAPMKRTTP